MHKMQFLAICSVLLAVSISSGECHIFGNWFEQTSGCTVLTEVPLVPSNPYYKAELFPSLNAKLSANQNRFDRDLHQVWVDAPDPSICGYATFGSGARCCLNGRIYDRYDYLYFASGEKKKIANEQLWREAQERHLPFYKVWADAPDRYCKKSYGSLADFFG